MKLYTILSMIASLSFVLSLIYYGRKMDKSEKDRKQYIIVSRIGAALLFVMVIVGLFLFNQFSDINPQGAIVTIFMILAALTQSYYGNKKGRSEKDYKQYLIVSIITAAILFSFAIVAIYTVNPFNWW